jgi:hypothetical protein
MSTPISFLSAEERSDLEKPGRAVPRSVEVIDPADYALGKRAPAKPLVEEVVTRIRSHASGRGRAGGWFAGLCVEVQEDDGMSWSAELTRRECARLFPDFQIHCLASQVSGEYLPEVADTIGWPRFVQIAHANNLAQFPFYLWGLNGLIVMAVTAACGLLYALRFAAPPVLAFVAVAGVLAGRLLTKRLAAAALKPLSRTVSDLQRRLVESASGHAVTRFVENLAAELGRGEFPRIVIVDNFARLSDVTRRVIRRYFGSECRLPLGSSGGECWVVFELGSGERLANDVLLRPAGPGFQRTTLYRQRYIHRQQRTELMALLGGDHAAPEALAVRQLCHGWSDAGRTT